MIRLLKYLWAFPMTLLGVCFVPSVLLTGGKVQITQGVVELYGGILQRIFALNMPFVGSGAAMTLGHTILARNKGCLERSRLHERVHVRQFERWGIFLLPAYWVAGCWVSLRGQHAYLSNPFEREAYEVEACGQSFPS